VLVLFSLHPGEWTTLFIVVALTVAMFTNLKFIHPVRTDRWRPLSLGMALGWVGFAAWAAWVDFNPTSWAHWGLMISSLYLVAAGVVQQVIPAPHHRS
jgi:phosphatidylcholine synthase